MTGERRRFAGGALLLLAACEGGFLPLRGKIEVGRDPMVVFVGGPAASSDLYALPADGGRAIAITFSPVTELRPALAPDGGAVAFLRAGSLGDSVPAGVWVLNLGNGREQQIELPAGAERPEQVGWSKGGRWLVVRAGGKLYGAEPPPATNTARPVAADERAGADSALAVLLGRPAFARVVPCEQPEALCVVGETGSPSLLAPHARDPARWGDDSVAYLQDDRLVVRPLGPGRTRRVEWTGVPVSPRQLSMFAGATAEPR
ncbi:MAG TPA: hypothetical protein VH680_18345 [Gemmatimonadales bacterium]